MTKVNLKRGWRFIWPYLVIILATTVVISPQLFSHVILAGDDTADTLFHYSRFYDTAMQFKTGIFSLFQTNFSFEQSGRIINAVYGPLFAYFNGLLILLTGNWFNYQILSIYVISLLGAGSMYHLLKKVGINKVLAVIFGIVYINIGMIPAFINHSSFNGWGQALMPLVVLCGVRMITDEQKTINWLQLMLVMSLLVQVHVLSTLMGAVLLVPFFIASLVEYKNRKDIWINFLKAVGGTIILSANVLGAFAALMSKNHLGVTSEFDLAMGGLQLNKLTTDYGTAFAYILPIFVVLIFLQVIYACFNFKKDKLNFFVTIWGFILLGISSRYFPWGTVQRHLPFLKSSFQFPFRLTVIAYPLIIVGMALTVKSLMEKSKITQSIAVVALALLVLETVTPTFITNKRFTAKYRTNTEIQRVANISDRSLMLKDLKYHYLPDYLPTKNRSVDYTAGAKYKELVVDRYRDFDHNVEKGGKLAITWQAKQKKNIVLPVMMYAQSDLLVNDHKFTGSKNEIGNPIVKQQVGHNKAVLSFKTPIWFIILNCISLFGWLAAICYGIWIKVRK